MSFGLEEARIRLDYINQHREITLGVYLALGAASWLLGVPVPLPILLVLVAWFALSVAYARVGRRTGTERLLHRVSSAYFVLEVLLLTLLAHLSGGAEWLGALFYAVTIIYANLLLPRRQGLWISALAAGSFILLTLFEYAGWVPHVALFAPGARYHAGHYVLATLAVATAAFCLIAYTTAQFSRMLQRKTEALAAANRDLQNATRDLRQHQNTLEDLVRERTGDLARAYDELWAANRELQRMNELKSNFLANVSHELRTPLTSIRSFSEILLQYPDEKTETRNEFLEIIINESNRLTRLINDVLDLAKIEAGRMEWRMEPIDLAAVATQAVEVVQIWAEQKRLRLTNAVAADLPSIMGDADRLHQVFTNLLSNALKFTREGHVTIGSVARANEVVIYVSDSGLGIAESELTVIFEKFHQHGDSYTGKPAGTGLGLSICREIMQHMGGRIWAESQLGVGSTFYCSFPAAVMAAEPAAQRASAG